MSRHFGPITQNGYVVCDIAAALDHWVSLGVGPWFYMERAPIGNFRFRDEPSDVHISIALANSGPLQIELIEQRNKAPSMYLEFLDECGEGLQHIAYWTETFDADMAKARALGWRVGQSGEVGADGRFAYFDTGRRPGTVVELSEKSGRKGIMFRRIREASAGWDGRDPIRTSWPIEL